MRNKVLLALALVALVAAGCNSNRDNAEETQQQTQQETQGNNDQQNVNTEQESTQPAEQEKDNNSSKPTFSGEDDVEAVDQPEVKEIKITASGFSPSTIEIRKGDYVQFTNTDSTRHWPASDPHPSHTGLAGFDAKKGLSQGETYRYQFNSTGTFSFHDHMNASLKGSVVVK